MKFLGLFLLFLLSYNAYSKDETIETSPKTAIGVIFKVESDEILKNPKFKKLTKEAGLYFDNYFPRAKVISLKVKEATTQLNHLEAFCLKISNFSKVGACELDYLLEPQDRELRTGEEKISPCPQEQLYPRGLDSFTTFANTVTNQLEECEFFPNSPLEDHPTDLSGYWAQEYTGADLLRRRIEAHYPPFRISENLIRIWDSRRDDHEAHVSNLIAGPYPTAVIPHRSTLRNYETNSISDKIQAYNVESLICRHSGQCTRYINNSMGWFNSFIIAGVVSDLVEEVGSVFITAAGNSNTGQLTELAKRDAAREGRVILVSSLDSFGLPSNFTDYAPEVSIAAPSDYFILSHHTDGSPRRFGGTSGAAPQVTGALAAFELITDYPLSTEESRLLLERTALPIPGLTSPSMLGAGMLNTYFIGDLAFRLNESCNDLETKQSCIEAALEDPTTYTRNQDISMLEELGDFFPSCGTPPQEELNSRSSCKDRRAFLERLRSLANISDQSDLFSAISCIYESEGFTQNAVFYQRLAERIGQTNQELAHQTPPSWANQVQYRHLLFENNLDELNYRVRRGGFNLRTSQLINESEAWENHPELIDILVDSWIEDEKFDYSIASDTRFQNYWMNNHDRLQRMIETESINDFVVSILYQPGWENHPELVEQLIDKGNVSQLVALVILSKPHWANHPELVQQLINQGNANEEIARHVLSQPHWANHPELVSLLIQRSDNSLSHIILEHVVRQDHWRSHHPNSTVNHWTRILQTRRWAND